MALQRIGAEWDHGVDGVTVDGVVEVTGYTARREYATQVEGVAGNGEVGAFLYGKEKITMQAEGYAEAGSLPAIGGDMSLKGVSGKIMAREIVGQAEDFVRVRVEGVGYPSLQ